MQKDERERYLTETVYDRETGLPRWQITTLNGKKHAPPDGTPSYVVFDDSGRPKDLIWHAYGTEHREIGPSTILRDPESDIDRVEVYKIHGKPRTPQEGPWRVCRYKDGEVWKEEYDTPSGQAPGLTSPSIDR